MCHEKFGYSLKQFREKKKFKLFALRCEYLNSIKQQRTNDCVRVANRGKLCL